MKRIGLSESRRQDRVHTATFATALVLAGMCLLVTLGCIAADANKTDSVTLKDAFKNDFLVGAAINRAQIYEQDSNNDPIIKAQFNSISPENVLKWEAVHPEPDKFDFSAADAYVNFGEKNHMAIIGHTLVWHSQTPAWVFEDANGKSVDRETLLNRMSNHIFTVMGRYKGRLKGWDVVNEAVGDDGTLRQSRWMRIIGEDFLVKAYEFAHAADPNAELYYNDFGLENPDKRSCALALIKNLQSRGVKITGIGLQGHYRLTEPDLKQVDETISAFSALGLKVAITELDINVLPSPTRSLSADVNQRFAARAALNPYTNGLPDSVQQELAGRYAGLFSVFLKHHGEISRVTFWGVSDGDSWLNDWPVSGRTSYPLLFDRNHAPKPAFRAVIESATQSQASAPPGGDKELVEKSAAPKN